MRYLFTLGIVLLFAVAFFACKQRPDSQSTYQPAKGSDAPAVIAGNAPQAPPSEIPADQAATPPVEGEQAAPAEGSEAAPAEGADTTKPEETKEADKEPPKDEATKPKEEAPVEPKIIPARELLLKMTNVTSAMFETSRGNFIVNIYPEIAPISAPHFIDLIKQGFYDGIKIHRYEPGFVIQMGQVISEDGNNTNLYPSDPKKAQLGSVTIQDEPCLSENTDMTVTFAKTSAPNSASCQFFINLGDNRRLDKYNTGFTVMGQVIHGQDVVRKLRAGDKIGRAYLIQPPRDVK
jgi:peptidyl-prolyl cis-trans isomerase B (cyclophilin B)